MIKDIERNGVLNGLGKPEKLKYRNGYSRRIDQYNRLIYDIVNEIGTNDIQTSFDNLRIDL